MKIALDVMGGDDAPESTLDGALRALEDYSWIETIYLVGDEERMKPGVDLRAFPASRIELVHAPEVVEMNDPALAALRKKKNSSITRGVNLVKSGDCQAVVSAGHTGAAVAASTVLLRNLPGVERAGIASPMPNEYGACNIVDAGANPEAKPFHLLQYAIMGSVYARYVFGVEKPVVGLMSLGEEDEKGTDFTKEVFELLKGSGLNFRGNVEGHDLFETPLDVVVCDGFVGNVVLKSCEATAKIVFKWVKDEIHKAGPLAKLGAFLAKPALRRVHQRGSYESYGGSPLLGVDGITIIGHGSSSAVAIQNAIRVAGEAIRYQVNPHITEEIQNSSPSNV